MLNFLESSTSKKQNQSKFSSWKAMGYLVERLSLFLGLSLMIAACSSISQPQNNLANSSVEQSMKSFPQYQATPGPYQVKENNNVELKKASGQPLPLKIYYPNQAGQFPIIIFSHGTGGSKDDHEALGRYWASYGYISLHPTHEDSLVLRGETLGGGNLRRILAQILRDPDSWQQRFQDISLIIDSLKQLENDFPDLKGKLNVNAIGVGGHSYGAYTAQVIGGATIDLPNGKRQQSFADRRVKAILLLSPQGSGQQGLTPSSWRQMTLPMMVMTGSLDRGAQGQGPEWKMQPFELAPPENKYLVFIEKANHFSFGGQGASHPSRRSRSQQQELIFNYIKIASLAYWDTYLNNRPEAKQFLHSQQLAQESKQMVSISTK